MYLFLGNETNCAKNVEFKCFNNRCIDKYLICDNHNNCGDSSDEWLHCLTKLEAETTTTERTSTTTTSEPPVYRPTPSIDSKSPDSSERDQFFLLSLFKSSSNFEAILFYILIVLMIIIVVTLINLIIWCLVTKRDQSFLDLSAWSQSVMDSTFENISQFVKLLVIIHKIFYNFKTNLVLIYVKIYYCIHWSSKHLSIHYIFDNNLNYISNKLID